jgi:ketose-bisphosphate aldolase
MTAKDWLQKAKKEHFAIGAFNVGNLETFKAIAQAAANKRSPVIIESSPGETKWMEADNIVDVAKNYSNDLNIPIFVNLDHGDSLKNCLEVVEKGYDLVHFDGSKLPYEENLEIVKQIVEEAHRRGLLVEGEIDHIAGSSEMHLGSAETEVKKGMFTDPEKAKMFVEESGIDIFAAFFGNVHGVFTEGGENLKQEILEKLSDVLSDTFFSLHGGSGIPDDQVQEAIARGIVKININTEMRQVFRENLESALDKNPNEIAMYKIEDTVVSEVQKIVEHKIEIFGSENKV